MAVPDVAVDDATAARSLVISLLRSVSVFRLAAIVWAALGLALSTEHLDHPAWAATLLALMAIATAILTQSKGGFRLVSSLRPSTLITELVIGAAVLVGDGLVYDNARPQSLPWSWPAAGVMAAGVVFGKRAGIAAALFTGSASLISEIVLLERDTGWVGGLSKIGLWLMAGALAGYVSDRLQRAEQQISVARARDEVARQLHDGVLQTLAVIQRRSGDEELSALARDQEHELRAFLAGKGSLDTDIDGDTVELEAELRRMAALHERRYDTTVQIIVALDCPVVSPQQTRHMLGAVGEAVTNASKHGEASKITVYAAPADDESRGKLEVSVTDNGSGFDVEHMTAGMGISESIRGRLAESGGSVEISSRPDRGTEVTLWT